MADYPTALVQLVDDRIDQSQVKPTKMGTVQDREAATARAIVAFDGGAGTGQPVKCFESVIVGIGDRVGLVKFEGEWVIVGNYTGRALGEALLGVDLSSSSTTTSATLVDMPTSPTAVLTKYRASTQLQIMIAAAMFSTDTTTQVEVAVNILSADSTVNTDLVLFNWGNVAGPGSTSMVVGGTTTALVLPGAQTYAVLGRWRRSSGAGTLTMNGSGNIMIHAKEVYA